MKNKLDLDQAVAVLLGLTTKDVSRITGAFFGEVKRLLIEEHEVNITSFGRMQMKRENYNGKVVLTVGTFTRGGRRKKRSIVVSGRYRVYFAQATSFKKAAKEQREGRT